MVDAATLAVLCAIVCGLWLLLAAAIPLGRVRDRRSVRPPRTDTAQDWVMPVRGETGTAEPPRGNHEARSLLQCGLRSDEREVRVAAITALSGLARDHEWALDGLLEALVSELETPERVATELDRLAPRPGTRLIPLLGHPSDVVRFYAVRLLVRYGHLAARHVPEMTLDASASVRAAALETLRAVPSGEALRCALRLLDDPSPTVRAQASRTAVAITPASARYVVPLLGDRSWWVRDATREALVAAGRDATTVVEPALQGPDALLRSGAALVLQDVGIIDALVEEADFHRLEPILDAGGSHLRNAASDRARRGVVLTSPPQLAAGAPS